MLMTPKLSFSNNTLYLIPDTQIQPLTPYTLKYQMAVSSLTGPGLSSPQNLPLPKVFLILVTGNSTLPIMLAKNLGIILHFLLSYYASQSFSKSSLTLLPNYIDNPTTSYCISHYLLPKEYSKCLSTSLPTSGPAHYIYFQERSHTEPFNI